MARRGTRKTGKANSKPVIEGSKRKRYANDEERRVARRAQSRAYYKRRNESLKAKGTSYYKQRRATIKRVDAAFARTKKGQPKGAVAKAWWNAQLSGFDYSNKRQAREFVKTYDEIRKMRRRRNETPRDLRRRRAQKWAELAKKLKLGMNQQSEFVRMMMSG